MTRGLLAVAAALALGAASPGEKGLILEDTSVWGIVRKGGWVMLPIGLCSVVALALIIERFIALQRKNHLPPGLPEELGRLAEEKGMDAMRARCADAAATVARVFHSLVSTGETPREAAEGKLVEELSRVRYDLRKNTRYLGIIANVAPMLGLLGTVLGMIKAFDKVAVVGPGRQDELAGGIAEALLTTAAGLVLAIPVLFLYPYFRGRIDDLIREMEEAGRGFIARLTRGGVFSPRDLAPLQRASATASQKAASAARGPSKKLVSEARRHTGGLFGGEKEEKP